MASTCAVSATSQHVLPSPRVDSESVDSDVLLQRLRNVHQKVFFGSNSALKETLKSVHAVELTKALKSLFAEMIQRECIADPVAFIDRLAGVIPFETMQKVVKADIDDILQEAKNMFEEAKLYLQAKQEKISPNLLIHIRSVIDGILSIIETIITGFGIGDFLNPSEGSIHADYKSQKIMMLFGLFGGLSTILFPTVGAVTGGLIIGGAILTIVALSLLWPLVKLRPQNLPYAVNLTKEIQNGGYVGHGRREALDEIAAIMTTNRHPILVGPSRVGKTLSARAFVRAINEGKYPALKGKTAFFINTADIVGEQASFLGGGNKILSTISAAMGKYRDDIILVFDEIHNTCKKGERIADQFKTFLDQGGAFPHVIGITTAQDYDAYIKDNNAFSLRFEKVEIKDTQEDETLEILSDALLRSPSTPLIHEDVLKYIFDKTSKSGDPQPNASLKVLHRCIHRTEKMQKTPTEMKIIAISNKIRADRSLAVACRGRKKNEGIPELEAQMKEVEELAKKEREGVESLSEAKELLHRVTEEMYTTILKVPTAAQKALCKDTQKQLNKFVLIREFMIRALESYIVEKASSLGVKAVIDKALVDEEC